MRKERKMEVSTPFSRQIFNQIFLEINKMHFLLLRGVLAALSMFSVEAVMVAIIDFRLDGSDETKNHHHRHPLLSILKKHLLDDVFVVVEFLKEHNLPKCSLRRARERKKTRRCV